MLVERPLIELAEIEANIDSLQLWLERETEAKARRGRGRGGQRRKQRRHLWDRVRHHLGSASDKPGR